MGNGFAAPARLLVCAATLAAALTNGGCATMALIELVDPSSRFDVGVAEPDPDAIDHVTALDVDEDAASPVRARVRLRDGAEWDYVIAPSGIRAAPWDGRPGTADWMCFFTDDVEYARYPDASLHVGDALPKIGPRGRYPPRPIAPSDAMGGPFALLAGNRIVIWFPAARPRRAYEGGLVELGRPAIDVRLPSPGRHVPLRLGRKFGHAAEHAGRGIGFLVLLPFAVAIDLVTAPWWVPYW
jgi:hypothetical protein